MVLALVVILPPYAWHAAARRPAHPSTPALQALQSIASTTQSFSSFYSAVLDLWLAQLLWPFLFSNGGITAFCPRSLGDFERCRPGLWMNCQLSQFSHLRILWSPFLQTSHFPSGLEQMPMKWYFEVKSVLWPEKPMSDTPDSVP